MNDIYGSLIDMSLVTGHHLSYLGYSVKNILKTIDFKPVNQFDGRSYSNFFVALFVLSLSLFDISARVSGMQVRSHVTTCPTDGYRNGEYAQDHDD